MNDHLLAAIAAIKDLMEARDRGEFDKIAGLRFVGHGSLFAADTLDGGEHTPIGSTPELNNACDDLRRVVEKITGRSFPQIPIGGPRGRNWEILKIALPIIVKILLPLLIAEAGPAVASAALLSLLDNGEV